MSYKANLGEEVCEQCGATFEKKAPHQRFCQENCSQRYWDKYKRGEKRKQRQCDMCDAWFMPRNNRQLRCSSVCMSKARSISVAQYKRGKKELAPEPSLLPMPDPVASSVVTQFPEGAHIWVAGAEGEECQGLTNPAI